MRKSIKHLLTLFLLFLLAGCTESETTQPIQAEAPSSLPTKAAETPIAQTAAPAKPAVPASIPKVQEHLFEAKDMDSIELTGQEILDGKEATMSITISDDIQMDFHLSRDTPNGTKLYAIYHSEATNLAYNYISPDVFDEEGEAIPDYTYQISCYDFNDDGVKEIIIACGNQKDTLSLFVFEPFIDSEIFFTPLNYILGYTNAYVNDLNEICVPSPTGIKPYKYNIAAYDAAYARLTGPLKISVSYADGEQLGKYESTHTFAINEDGPELLILPTETLKDFRITHVEYDADNNNFNETENLYTLPSLTPDEPLILKFYMPDLPSIKASYTDSSGIKQSCIIAESGMDGSIFLIEQGK